MSGDEALERMARQLESIGRIEKCRGCSCYVETLQEFQGLVQREGVPRDDPTARKAEALFRSHPTEHGCLGCNPCYPVSVSNRIHEREPAVEDRGLALPVLHASGVHDLPPEAVSWPAVPGEYVVGNIRAPVVVSTLGSPELVPTLVAALGLREIALVGKTETENLGVEKVARNVVANPSLRALLLCGDEAEGHRPGATLLALARNGIDDEGRVVGSPGRRPILRNMTAAEVARFREQVDVIDLIGEKDPRAVGERVAAEASKARSPLGAWTATAPVPAEDAPSPPPWVPDPKGYFVILLDPTQGQVILEGYAYDGRLLGILRSPFAKPLCHAAILRGWVSRFDHAAYLGRELARAGRALSDGKPYVQDAA